MCWKFLWLAMLVTLPLAVAGCGGFNASHSVSPASFFLPGLMKNEVPTKAPELMPVEATEIAAAR
jgi:hypothetical protein